MAKLEYKDGKPVFGLKTRDGLFYYVFALISFLIAAANPAPAFAYKKSECALSSPQLIPAKAAILVDAKKAVIYAKNSEAKLPPASTTKLVTAMVVLDRLNFNAMVKITKNAATVHSISPRLRTNEEFTVSDLLHLALMKSVNSAAVALAEAAAGSEEQFVELMNQKVQAIGALNSQFANASGLPKRLQYTTVYDLTLILGEALKYPLIKEILRKRECLIVTKGRNILIKSTDRLLWATGAMIGGKTGYTSEAQHCFVGAMQTDGGPIFTAVMGTTSRNRLWSSAALLFSLASGPQSIQSIRAIYKNKAGAHAADISKKNSKAGRLSKRGHEKQLIRLARK